METTIKKWYINAPCKGCTKRYLGCHSECNDYIEYDKANKAKRQFLYHEREKDSVTYSRNIPKKKILEV